MKKILVVSSDRNLLDILRNELTSRNYTVLTEADPYLVFAVIKNFAPDLLVIDFILNDHNGGAISRQLKGNSQTDELPIIILSDSELETRYPSRFGCEMVIQKTGNLYPINRGINHILGAHELVPL